MSSSWFREYKSWSLVVAKVRFVLCRPDPVPVDPEAPMGGLGRPKLRPMGGQSRSRRGQWPKKEWVQTVDSRPAAWRLATQARLLVLT